MPNQGLPLPTFLNNGHYRVDRLLSVGGLSLIYHGMDTKLNRPVAIKELFPRGSERADGLSVVPSSSYGEAEWARARAEYLDEARMVASFDHPGVVDVYDYFEENNSAYMVMKFISGQTLEQHTVERGGRLPEAEAREFIRQVGEALQQLHSQEPPIYHRDLKPRNIMVTGQGRAVLIDFGATREYMTEVAGPEEALFTPGYAPPEQLALEQATRPHPTIDVFALGATMYYLLIGSDPYTNGFKPPNHVSESTRKATMHALQPDPAHRPQAVRAFLNELYELSGLAGLIDATPLWLRYLGGFLSAILIGVLTNWLSGGGIVALFNTIFAPAPPMPTIVPLPATPTAALLFAVTLARITIAA